MAIGTRLAGLQGKIIADAVSASPQLQRGQVWCRHCAATQRVDSTACLATGWPKCCSSTMTIDAPRER